MSVVLFSVFHLFMNVFYISFGEVYKWHPKCQKKKKEIKAKGSKFYYYRGSWDSKCKLSIKSYTKINALLDLFFTENSTAGLV